ncbi:MAG TPA: ABC transporter permease subunit [Longimicrobiales bacterium]
MSRTFEIARYQAADMLRSRWLIVYAVLIGLATELLFRFGSSEQMLLTLTTALLLIAPLVALTFGLTHFYNSGEFLELMLAQPIRRRELFRGVYVGVAVPLAAALLAGTLLPLLLHGLSEPGLYSAYLLIVASGVALTFAFVGVAFLIANVSRDKTRGLGTALIIWLLLAIIYDALVMVAVSVFTDYPLEVPVLVAMFFNPLDLVRTMVMLRLDAAALMGYSGAVFARFLNSVGGGLGAVGALGLWVVVPVLWAERVFNRRDF